ncbi:YeeE/YedE family protein [Parasphingopyxis marina]|uniref:YeeE/YedE family protein n=1 Tax=Parasphingopyxis marina TaxID=2761622 RepID=A0A842HXE3_9SPHN|nr:YeeE/YedE thiosulfate transporter family protein [Parasphingopyxis marina]MBC2777097.1 YeeE/YedE family protein [Parasphingopyxis marina]
MMETFPPIVALAGGALIGLAAAVMLLGSGRIAGVSGLTGRATGIGGARPEPFAILFLAGLLIGALAVALLTGGVVQRFPPHLGYLIAGGLIVGVGTRMGSGCTSGHGVCGVSRLSRRSIVATLVFMASGIATVAIMNALGWGW